MPRRWTGFFSSSPAAGAQEVSADGSSFEVQLDIPIVVPASAADVEVGLIKASIWNTSPNVSPAFANNVFSYTTTVAPAGTYQVVLPEGLFSLSGLSAYLSGAFTNNGHPSGLFIFGGLEATQQTAVVFSKAGDTVDFSVPGSIGALLGFPTSGPGSVITAPLDGYRALSPNSATFNRVNSYVIGSDRFVRGLNVNGEQLFGAVGNVPITAAPGSQINFDPRQIVWVPADELRGAPIVRPRFTLRDQDGRPTPTGGEDWSFVIEIRWRSG